MTNENVLQEYSDSIRIIRKQCLEAGLSEEEFRQMYFESLKSLDSNPQAEARIRPMPPASHKLLLIGIIICILACSVYNYKTIYTCVVCNLQDYIYPGLRLLRRLSIPLISLFPSLTELYHETCLVQNPFFTVADMDCWPCSSINSVREVNNPAKPFNPQQNIPYIYKTDQQMTDIPALKAIYFKNKQIFDKEAAKILVDNQFYITPYDMFTQNQLGEKLYTWKLNNMHVARVLRQYFPRPKIVPKFGQSTERFIIIDSSQKSFRVPDTECSFSFLLSLSGSRTIKLVPAEECKHQCKSLRVELKETYLLWYNWWYWRPVVQTTSSNITFMAHIGSYC